MKVERGAEWTARCGDWHVNMQGHPVGSWRFGDGWCLGIINMQEGTETMNKIKWLRKSLWSKSGNCLMIKPRSTCEQENQEITTGESKGGKSFGFLSVHQQGVINKNNKNLKGHCCLQQEPLQQNYSSENQIQGVPEYFGCQLLIGCFKFDYSVLGTHVLMLEVFNSITTYWEFLGGAAG